MRASPVDLIGGFYTSDSLPWACQDTVNWLPVMAEVAGTRTVSMLRTPPGLRAYQIAGTGPLRGMHDLEGARYVVSGQTLCRINANKSVDPIGTIPGVGRVSMTHNQFQTGYQLLVENGQAGGGYVYNTVDRTFGRITDTGYPGSVSSDYLDSFLLGVEPFGRFWFHSDLASATDYNTLDRYEAESSPDKIVGLAVSRQEVVVFGERTTEFFMNTGQAQGTFQNRNTGIDRGCASRDTIAKLDNTLFWLGDDGIVYRLNGYQQVPVSTRALEQAIAGYNLAQAFAFTWEDRGHKVYYLSFPDGKTFGYDVITGLWHRRESFGMERWRLSHTVKWGGKWYGGDFQNGRIWLLDWDYHLEGADPIISERVSPVLHDDQSAISVPHAELVFDTGQLPTTMAEPFPGSLTLTGNPPSILFGLPYPPFSFGVSGGVAPYSFTVASGQMPVGLVLQQDGSITGVPALGGTFRFTVRVFDSSGKWTESAYTITIETSQIGAVTPARAYFGDYTDLRAFSAVSPDLPLPGAFAVSPNGAYAFVGATGSLATLYQMQPALQSYAVSTNISETFTTQVRACDFSRDGLHLAAVYSISGTTNLVIFRFENGIWTKKSQDPINSNVSRIKFSPNGKYIAVSQNTGSPEYGLRVYKLDVETSQLQGYFRPSQTRVPAPPSGFGWSPDSKYLVTRGAAMTAWEVSDTALTYRSTAAGTPNSAYGAHFSEDGNIVYVVANNMGTTPIAAYAFSNGVFGGVVQSMAFVPFPVIDSDFSSGYLAISKSGGSAAYPSFTLYRCNGVNVEVAPDQPIGMTTEPGNAIRWTI